MARFGRGFIGRQALGRGPRNWEAQALVPIPAAPVVVTDAATGVTGTTGTLNGDVNPGNLATTVHFQWGTTSSYGNTTADQNAGSGGTTATWSAALTGLTTNQVIHYRVVAVNAFGTSYGADLTFTPAYPVPTPGTAPARGAPPFSYPAWDLTSMTQLDLLPYSGVQFGEVLNQPGSWQGALQLTDPRVQALSWADSSRTGRTLLCVELGGVPVWGGIIWTRRYTKSTGVLQIGAQEIGSYFQARLQAADYSTTWNVAADPMTIARTVVSDAAAVATIAGGITLTLNPAAGSGQTVQASFPGTQLQTIESIVSNLSQMGYTLGFDYSFDVTYAPGTKTPVITMNFWYPRKGRTAAQTQILVMSKDALDFTYDEDSTRQFNEITETGSGTGGLQPVKVSASTPGYPLLQTAVSHTDINDLGILSNAAFNDLEQSVWPVTTPTLTLPVPLPDPVTGVVGPERLALGGFTLGDDLIYRIDPVSTDPTVRDSENTDPRFPNGMSFEWRITNWTVSVPEQGVPSMLFDLSVPPINTVPPTQPPLV